MYRIGEKKCRSFSSIFGKMQGKASRFVCEGLFERLEVQVRADRPALEIDIALVLDEVSPALTICEVDHLVLGKEEMLFPSALQNDP